MPNKNYERGRASEYKAQRDLESLGYQTTRTAGSHGAADVIAWNGYHTRYVQCKTYTRTKSDYGDDCKKMSSLVLPPNSQVEMWVRKVGQSGWESQTVTRLRTGWNDTVEGIDSSTWSIVGVAGTRVFNTVSVTYSPTPAPEPSLTP